MECPDCFPWATLFGVLGTLIGAAVGSWLAHRYAAKQAAAEREYQDRTRFHRERLEAYAEFLGAHSHYQAILTFIADKDDDTKQRTITEQRHALSRYNAANGRAKLLATDRVQRLLADVVKSTEKLREGAGPEQDNLERTLLALIELQEAMKVELGIAEAC